VLLNKVYDMEAILLIFGFMRGLGRGVKEFKDGVKDVTKFSEDEDEKPSAN
jgi:hypothetical protein